MSTAQYCCLSAAGTDDRDQLNTRMYSFLYAAEQILLRLKNAFVFVLCENPRRHLES
jgi:hypothetical protein